MTGSRGALVVAVATFVVVAVVATLAWGTSSTPIPAGRAGTVSYAPIGSCIKTFWSGAFDRPRGWGVCGCGCGRSAIDASRGTAAPPQRTDRAPLASTHSPQFFVSSFSPKITPEYRVRDIRLAQRVVAASRRLPPRYGHRDNQPRPTTSSYSARHSQLRRTDRWRFLTRAQIHQTYCEADSPDPLK